MHLTPQSKVEVFGEFSPEQPWQVRIPCKYDPILKCFKAELVIRMGQSFKFIINGGKSYLVSDRYPCKIDSDGNINNIFIPDQIRRHRDGGRKFRGAQSSDELQWEQQIYYSASYGDYRANLIDQNNNSYNRPQINAKEYPKSTNNTVIHEVSLEYTQDHGDGTENNNNHSNPDHAWTNSEAAQTNRADKDIVDGFLNCGFLLEAGRQGAGEDAAAADEP